MIDAELRNRVVRMASEDEYFRQRLLNDPMATLAQAAGGAISAAEGLRVQVLEESATQRYLVLPYVGGDSGVLEEADLDAVVGAATKPPPPLPGPRQRF